MTSNYGERAPMRSGEVATHGGARNFNDARKDGRH